MTNPRSKTHADLVQELTEYVTHSLGHWHGEEDYQRYQTLCPPAFQKLSEGTLDLLAEFGRKHGRDAVPEHLGVRGLINANADKKYYLYFALMQEAVANEERKSSIASNSSLDVPVCISFHLYDPYIDAIASGISKAPAARTEYYRALAGVVFALMEKDETSLVHKRILSENAELADHEIEVGDYTPIGESPVIKDATLIELVIRNVDRADEVKDCIRNRGMLDVKTLSKYLIDYHPAISVGVL